MKNYTVYGIRENHIPIGGYMSPTPQSARHPEKGSLITESVYEKVKESGLDFLIAFYESVQADRTQFLQSLRLAEKFGIGIMIRDDNFYAYRPYDEQAFLQTLPLYRDSPAFCGIHVCDEPGRRKFELIQKMQTDLAKHCPGKTCYVNLFPHFASPQQLLSDLNRDAENADYDYQRYLQDYIRIVSPPYISFDYYPLTEVPGKIYSVYYRQLETIRQAAASAGIPFWCFVQTTNWWPPFRTPMFSEILFQVCTSLAFGARGIQYFPFCTPNGDTGNETFLSAVLDLDGNRTSVFAAVKYANEHISVVSETLLSSEHLGVLCGGRLPAVLPDGCTAEKPACLRRFSARHTLAGLFRRKEDTVLYAVNSDMEETEELELQLYHKRRTIVTLGAQKICFESELIRLQVKPGEGVLIEIF